MHRAVPVLKTIPKVIEASPPVRQSMPRILVSGPSRVVAVELFKPSSFSLSVRRFSTTSVTREFSSSGVKDTVPEDLRGVVRVQVRRIPEECELPKDLQHTIYNALQQDIKDEEKQALIGRLAHSFDPANFVGKFLKMGEASTFSEFEKAEKDTDAAYKELYDVTSSLHPSSQAIASVTFKGVRSFPALYLAFEVLDNFDNSLPGIISSIFSEKSKDEIKETLPKDGLMEFGRLAVVRSLRGTGVVKYLLGHTLKAAMSFEQKPQVVCVCANTVRKKLIEEGFKVQEITGEISQLMDEDPAKEAALRTALKDKLGFSDDYTDHFFEKYLRTQKVRIVVITDPDLHAKYTSGADAPATVSKPLVLSSEKLEEMGMEKPTRRHHDMGAVKALYDALGTIISAYDRQEKAPDDVTPVVTSSSAPASRESSALVSKAWELVETFFKTPSK